MQSTNDARILRGAAMSAAPVALVSAVLSAVLAGSKGLVGALVALAAVLVFFVLGFAALMRVTRDRPQLAMTAGLLVYVVQLLLIGVFIAVFNGTTAFSGRAFGLTLVATVLAWLAGQIRMSLTSRMFYVDPVPSAPAAGTALAAETRSGDGT
jgi:ATP synthase protein I